VMVCCVYIHSHAPAVCIFDKALIVFLVDLSADRAS
jgi:hypothetical protein